MIVQDGPSPGRFESGHWDELWAFSQIPASLADTSDPADLTSFRLAPVPGEIRCRIFTVSAGGTPGREARNREWAARMDLTETETPDPTAYPWLHRTPTVDVVVVISGEMDLVLDSGDEVHLRAGDSVIQRGTMHAWRATGDEPCVAVNFMVRAE